MKLQMWDRLKHKWGRGSHDCTFVCYIGDNSGIIEFDVRRGRSRIDRVPKEYISKWSNTYWAVSLSDYELVEEDEFII